MRHLAIIAAATLVAIPAAAAPAPRTFDLITYTSPDGFTVDASASDHVVITRAGSKSYCVIGVFPGTPASDSLEASFAEQWSDVVLHSVDPVAAPQPARVTVAGAVALAGMATTTVGGKPVIAMLTTIDAGAKVASIFVLVPDADALKVYSPYLATFYASLRVQRVDPPAAAPADPAAPASPPPSGGQGGVAPPTQPLTLADLAGEWNDDEQSVTNYVNATTGSYAGASSVGYTTKLTISAKGTVDTEFHGVTTTSSSAAFVNEKHHAQISVKPDGTIHIHVKAGEGNDWDYLIRGWQVTPDATVLKVVGPYYTIGVPDVVRKNPTYGTVVYFVRKNKGSK